MQHNSTVQELLLSLFYTWDLKSLSHSKQLSQCLKTFHTLNHHTAPPSYKQRSIWAETGNQQMDPVGPTHASAHTSHCCSSHAATLLRHHPKQMPVVSVLFPERNHHIPQSLSFPSYEWREQKITVFCCV